MAVAVKNTPETASASLLDRIPIASLAGAAYILGTLGIVFYFLPFLWQSQRWEGHTALMIRSLIQMAALAGLLWYGARLLGANTAAGVRAGIFMGFAGFVLLLLLTRWASLWIEYWSFDRSLFGPSAGAIATAAVGLALLIAGVWLLFRPGTEKFLVGLEEQGWFTPRSYKGLQGVRVRRGTIFGILLLFGSGIWTMMSHGTLRKGSADWHLNVPFTGQVAIESTGDVSANELAKYDPDWESQLSDHTLVLDRFALQEINKSIDPATHVKIIERGSSDFSTNEVVDRSKYNAEIKKLRENEETEPQVGEPQPAWGKLMYRSLTLLPSVQFTIPLLMLAAGLWLAWRVVNVPGFADFLIATEAEMNKVSWTTQRRLIQDTIVVLVTVVLMAFYLFSMDVVWKSVLSWKYIGVLKISSEEQREATQPLEDRPY